MDTTPSTLGRLGRAVLRWFDTGPLEATDPAATATQDKIEWARILPFIGMHAACLFVIAVGWSPIAVTVAVIGYSSTVAFGHILISIGGTVLVWMLHAG